LRSLVVIALVALCTLLVLSPLLGQVPDGFFKLIMFMIILSPIGLMIVVIETFYESAQQVGGPDDGHVPYVLAFFSAVGAIIGTAGGFALAAVIDLGNVFLALLIAGLVWGASILYVSWARHLDHVDSIAND
jgi:hypothetical protein